MQLTYPGSLMNARMCAPFPGHDGKVLSSRVEVVQLRVKNPTPFYSSKTRKAYMPRVGDTIVGIVTSKSSTLCKVDVGYTQRGILSLHQVLDNGHTLVPGRVVVVQVQCLHNGIPVLRMRGMCNFTSRTQLVLQSGSIVRHAAALCSDSQEICASLSREATRTPCFELVAGANKFLWLKSLTPRKTASLFRRL